MTMVVWLLIGLAAFIAFEVLSALVNGYRAVQFDIPIVFLLAILLIILWPLTLAVMAISLYRRDD